MAYRILYVQTDQMILKKEVWNEINKYVIGVIIFRNFLPLSNFKWSCSSILLLKEPFNSGA